MSRPSEFRQRPPPMTVSGVAFLELVYAKKKKENNFRHSDWKWPWAKLGWATQTVTQLIKTLFEQSSDCLKCRTLVNTVHRINIRVVC